MVYTDSENKIIEKGEFFEICDNIEMKKAYYNDPVGFGTALREACRNIMNLKMKTKAFLEPSEDAPYLTDLYVKPDEWGWEKTYTVSKVKYLVTNVVNTVILVVRIIM